MEILRDRENGNLRVRWWAIIELKELYYSSKWFAFLLLFLILISWFDLYDIGWCVALFCSFRSDSFLKFVGLLILGGMHYGLEKEEDFHIGLWIINNIISWMTGGIFTFTRDSPQTGIFEFLCFSDFITLGSWKSERSCHGDSLAQWR